MVYLPHWNRVGIKQISDLFDEHENCFLPFLSVHNKYMLNCHFLQYHSLKYAIPQSWKKLLHVNSGDSTTCSTPPPPPNRYYNMQDVIRQTVNLRKCSSSHFRKKKLLSLWHRKRESKKIHLLPFIATKEFR